MYCIVCRQQLHLPCHGDFVTGKPYESVSLPPVGVGVLLLLVPRVISLGTDGCLVGTGALGIGGGLFCWTIFLLGLLIVFEGVDLFLDVCTEDEMKCVYVYRYFNTICVMLYILLSL